MTRDRHANGGVINVTSVLEQLRDMTTVVADTGDLDAVRDLKPVDCTTNPSLVLKAFDDPASNALLQAEISAARGKGHGGAAIAAQLAVALGTELAKLVPGRVSTEVEANLSYDANASIARAKDIIEAYAARGVGKDRILIKLAATWEGIRAAEALQKEGIDCNLTLIFGRAQAIAAADAGAFLISPFVGRITDWYKKRDGVDSYTPDADPGVASVRSIYNYYKSNGISTIVMGASFRNAEQIKALAGCDNLTISPALLNELDAETTELPRALSPDAITAEEAEAMPEPKFRWDVASDAMAHDLLADGIRRFDQDYQRMLAKVS